MHKDKDSVSHATKEATTMKSGTKLLVGMIAASVLLGVAGMAVDWRFWYRWHTIPDEAGEWPDSYYKPVFEVPGDHQPFFPVVSDGDHSIAPAALEAAADWAEAHNSAALLVLHRGVVQLERYWQGIDSGSHFTGRAMTRSLIPPLVAIAIAEGAIESVDDPVGRYLAEWQDDPRGAITIKQFLYNLSGLENPALVGDPDPDNKSTRLALGGNSRKAALAFDLENRPGGYFALSNANAQIVAMVLESATGEAYESYFNSRLWARLGAGPAFFFMDSKDGMPASYCCFRATPRDWLRYGAALLNDGRVGGTQIWPSGWVGEMTTPSDYYSLYAYQIWVGNPGPGEARIYSESMALNARHGEGIRADGAFYLEGGGDRTMYVLPEQELVILRLGYYDADWNTSALPNMIMEGIQVSRLP